jgi:hypothetical protein
MHQHPHLNKLPCFLNEGFSLLLVIASRPKFSLFAQYDCLAGHIPQPGAANFNEIQKLTIFLFDLLSRGRRLNNVQQQLIFREVVFLRDADSQRCKQSLQIFHMLY